MKGWTSRVAVPLIALLGFAATGVRAQETSASGPVEVVEAVAVEASKPVPIQLDSLRSAMRTFLEAMKKQPQDYEAAVSCLDLSLAGDEKAQGDATKLFGILNRIENVASWLLPDARAVGPDGTEADRAE